MELNKNIFKKFEIRGDRIFLFKMGCFIEMSQKIDGYMFIYLDDRFIRETTSLIKESIENKLEFYLISPKFKNPKFAKFNEDFHDNNIENFINCLKIKEFHIAFNKIEFDPISNLVKYKNEFDVSEESIKNHIETISKKVKYSYNNWFSREPEYDYNIDIRNYFSNLWRSIKLSSIIN